MVFATALMVTMAMTVPHLCARADVVQVFAKLRTMWVYANVQRALQDLSVTLYYVPTDALAMVFAPSEHAIVRLGGLAQIVTTVSVLVTRVAYLIL